MDISIMQQKIKEYCKAEGRPDYQSILKHFKSDIEITKYIESEQGIDWLMWLLGT